MDGSAAAAEGRAARDPRELADTSALLAILQDEPERRSYALARSLGEPLLFKGSDFGLTDLAVAAAPAG